MNIFKMTDNKSLITTAHNTIYQSEDNVHALRFILPTMYGNHNLSDCSILLRMLLPNGTGRAQEITASKQVYNDNYLIYSLKLSSCLTHCAGEIKVWLSIISADGKTLLRTGTATIDIVPVKDIVDCLPEDDRSTLDSIEAKIAKLEAEKADNISYDDENGSITLTAQGSAIGDKFNVDAWNDDGFIDFDRALDAEISGGYANEQKEVSAGGS